MSKFLRFGCVPGVVPNGYELSELACHGNNVERELARALLRMRADLAGLASETRKTAAELQVDIDRGVAVRQSIEAKQARVDVMTVCADRMDRLLSDCDRCAAFRGDPPASGVICGSCKSEIAFDEAYFPTPPTQED